VHTRGEVYSPPQHVDNQNAGHGAPRNWAIRNQDVFSKLIDYIF
jgi:hypothetical protein